MNQPNRSTDYYFTAEPKSKERFGLVRTSLCGRGFEFLTASSVFSKRRVDPGTRLLVESMVLPKIGCVLDIGCGYGAVGIAAAALNPKLRVVMTDVNVRAVRLAKKNVELNKIANAEVVMATCMNPWKAWCSIVCFLIPLLVQAWKRLEP